MSSTTTVQVRTLSNGQQIPRLGPGMWQIPDGSTAETPSCGLWSFIQAWTQDRGRI